MAILSPQSEQAFAAGSISCRLPVSFDVALQKLRGRNLAFKISDLQPLLDPAFHLESLTIELKLKAPKKGAAETEVSIPIEQYSLALNGIKTSRGHGKPVFEESSALPQDSSRGNGNGKGEEKLQSFLRIWDQHQEHHHKNQCVLNRLTSPGALSFEQFLAKALGKDSKGNSADKSQSSQNSKNDDRKPASDAAWIRANLLEQWVGGAYPFDFYLRRIVAHKGTLLISVKGPGQIESATLVAKGYKLAPGCDTATPTPLPSSDPTPTPFPSVTPTPSPTPAPVAPQVTIDHMQPDAAVTNSSTMSFEFSSDQVGVTFYCSWDSAAAEVCSSPAMRSDLGNGSHQFSVYAVNSANLSSPAVSRSWKVDRVPPVVTISAVDPSAPLNNSRSITLSFSSSKAGTVRFQCSLDGGAYANCVSPATFSGIEEGVHEIAIVAIDSLGNKSAQPAMYQWSTDLTAPVATIESVSPQASVTRQRDLSIVFSADESSSFACSLDGGASQACQSPLALSGLAEGSHVLSIQPVDAAGNVGAPASYQWIIDLTAPSLSKGNVIPAEGLTSSRHVSAEFIASELSSFACSVDGGAAVQCSSPFSADFASDGAHSMTVTAIDQAGNSSTPLEFGWNVDATAPLISFASISPSSASFINSTQLSASISSSESARFQATLDGASLGESASPVMLSGLSEGEHVLSVSAVDEAGNVSQSISHSFTVDLTAPIVSIDSMSAQNLTRETSNLIAFSANEAGASFACNQDEAGFAPCSSPYAMSSLVDGDHVFRVRATDRAGNVSGEVIAQWRVDTIAPETSIALAPQGSERTTVGFLLSASEDGSTFRCSLDGAELSDCSDRPVYSGLSAGSHAFIAKATDPAGNEDPAGASYSFLIKNDVKTFIVSTSPALSAELPYTNLTSMSFTFGSNISGVTYACSLDNAAFTSCASTATYSGLSNGSHQLRVKATDGFGTQDPTGASYSWTVDTAVPTILTTSATVTRTSFTVTWTTNEPSTSKLNWGLNTATDQVVLDDGVYSTSHSVTVENLTPGMVYSYTMGGKDRAGNPYTSSRRSVRLNP